MRRERRRGFTLVELLVVIGILAVLMGVLLPALGKARQAGMTIKCSANLHSIGQAISVYVAENKGSFPACYMYVGQTMDNNSSSSAGYIHWSSYLIKKAGNSDPNAPDSIYKSLKGWEMFQCPSLENGGLSPTHTYDANYDSGASNPDAGIIDQQAPRMAYTVNEAVMPRNKFKKPDDSGTVRTYRFVRFSQIKKPNRVILATEFIDDWRVVSDVKADDANPQIKSHRPVHGFVPVTAGVASMLDLNTLGSGGGTFRGGGGGGGLLQMKRATAAEVMYPVSVDTPKTSRLNWVGRNHGSGKTAKTNFLYVDGHVETKTIEDTLKPIFEWGAECYSLSNNGDIEHNDD